MPNENMNAIVEARLVAAVAAEARLTALIGQVVEVAGELRNQIAGAQLAHLRIFETPPHRRSSDAPRATGSLTFDAADKVQPSKWPPRGAFEPGEQLP